MQGNIDPDETYDRRASGYKLPQMTNGYFTCVVAAGAIDNYDESGGFPISFQGHPPFVPLPDSDLIDDEPTPTDQVDSLGDPAPNEQPPITPPKRPPPVVGAWPSVPNPTYVDPTSPAPIGGAHASTAAPPPRATTIPED